MYGYHSQSWVVYCCFSYINHMIIWLPYPIDIPRVPLNVASNKSIVNLMNVNFAVQITWQLPASQAEHDGPPCWLYPYMHNIYIYIHICFIYIYIIYLYIYIYIYVYLFIYIYNCIYVCVRIINSQYIAVVTTANGAVAKRIKPSRPK